METLRTLFWADGIAITRWFFTKSASRLTVAGLFILLFASVAYGIWGISDVFFRSLALYDRFGAMTAGYIIHAAILVVLWLALGSSIASSVGFLLSTTPSVTFLLSLPVRPKQLSLWLYIKSAISNYILMMFAFLPIALAYGRAFDALDILFVFRVLLILLCIVLVSSGIGMVAGLASVAWLRGKEYPSAIFGMGVFFSVMVGMLRVIFPPALSKLYDASAPAFLTLFEGLPLNNPAFPTLWLSRALTDGYPIGMLGVLSVTAVIVYVTLGIQRVRLVPVLLRVRSAPHVQGVSSARETLEKASHPLMQKDWLSILRVPSETGYGLFLASVAVFFFLFLSFGVGHQLRQESWRIQLTVFSFAWLVFFATALFLRFLFPLIAREGKSAWFIFTIPIRKKDILAPKIRLGLIFAVPIMAFAVCVWYMLPFVGAFRGQLISLSVVTIILLALAHVLLGSIFPNFSQGNDPEKVSTSGMGILTLLVSGIIAFLGGVWIEHIVKAEMWGYYFSLIVFAIGMFLLSGLFFASRESMKRWEW